MAAIFSHAPGRVPPHGRAPLKHFWQHSTGVFRDGTTYGDPENHVALKLCAIAGVALLCVAWGFAVVIAEWNALIVGLALFACVLIVLDFRIGVVLLIMLMPISLSTIWPHEIGGVTGLNPVNLLLAGTLGSFLLHVLLHKSIARAIPRPLLWLYIVPFLIAGALGCRHTGQIALYFVITEYVKFNDVFGYLRDMVAKPLLLVAFALLIAAAVARMQRPEKLLGPLILSVWIMSLMAIAYFVLSGANLGQLASNQEREFLSPLGLHANELGRMYAIAYALLLFTWAETKDYGVKLILLASIGLVVVALVLTFSRSGFVGVVFATVWFLISRRQIGSLLVGTTVVAAALYFLPDAIYVRATYGFGMGVNAISAGRVNGIWIPLVPDLLRSPLYGNGVGAMLWSDAVRSGRSLLVTHPHNAYLRTILDMGVIGLVLVSAYFFHVWKGFKALSTSADLSSSMRGFYQGAATALLAFLTMAFADGSLTPAPEQAFLWLAIGMMYGERARRVAS
jgi:hypothetical protein